MAKKPERIPHACSVNYTPIEGEFFHVPLHRVGTSKYQEEAPAPVVPPTTGATMVLRNSIHFLGASELIAFGPSPRRANGVMDEFRAMSFGAIVNVRPSGRAPEDEARARWYEEKLEQDGALIRFMRHPVNDECGRIKDPAELLTLVKRIVTLITADKVRVYIHCVNGNDTAAYIALCVWHWLRADASFDPIECMRDHGFFYCARSPEQVADVAAMCSSKHIHQTMKWFNVKQGRKRKNKQ